MCFRSSVWRGFCFFEFASVGQANMVNKNVKALPAPETKTAWVSAPLPAFGLGWRLLWVERDGTKSATCDHRQPLSFFRRTRQDWGRGEARGRRVLRPDGVVFSLYRRGAFVARCAFRVVVGTFPLEELAQVLLGLKRAPGKQLTPWQEPRKSRLFGDDWREALGPA